MGGVVVKLENGKYLIKIREKENIPLKLYAFKNLVPLPSEGLFRVGTFTDRYGHLQGTLPIRIAKSTSGNGPLEDVIQELLHLDKGTKLYAGKEWRGTGKKS